MTERDPVAHLARLIEEASGNVVPPGHYQFLAAIALRRAHSHSLPDVATYVARLERGALGDEWRELLPRITVKESYLFRTPQHFAAIERVVVPALLPARAMTRRLRAWSAGCAHGEEPVTLAIVLAGCERLAGWDWSVEATDVDEHALAGARRGLYGERALSQVPPALRARFFVPRGDQGEVRESVRQRIVYRHSNLVREPFPLPAEPFDLVMLRNVLIYFRPESQRRVIAGVARALAPDGFLFLGPSETLWQLSDDLEPVDLGDCFCYRPRPSGRARAPRSAAAGPPGQPRQPARPRPAPPAAPPAETLPAEPPPSPGWGTPERLAEAARLLAANRPDEAAELIRKAREADPTDAPAHALEGFLHDVGGRAEQAIAAYRAALFLDARLFQVRILLADCLRRSGWDERARGEYREVLSTLAGRPRTLEGLESLPFPTAEQAERRARDTLKR